ncbi:MAG: hypothetical protein ABJ215_00270 [Alphaproteobacteria bacterium]
MPMRVLMGEMVNVAVRKYGSGTRHYPIALIPSFRFLRNDLGFAHAF